MVCKGQIKKENQNNEIHNSLSLNPDPALLFGPWDYQQVVYTDEGLNLGHQVPGFFEFEELAYYSPMMNITSQLDWFSDFEDISGDIQLWDFELLPTLPIDENPNSVVKKNGSTSTLAHQSEDTITNSSTTLMPTHYSNSMNTSNMTMNCIARRNNGKRKPRPRPSSSALRLEDIQKYFHVPITQAAKELNIGLTLLKKRCRELNIMRWPHRKIKSLESLIHNVKELGMSNNEVEKLEKQKAMVEKIPQMELSERTKKLRQACFKVNYKKKKSLSSNGYLVLASSY